MKPGYLYVLVHPSDPGLYKIGVTILKPEKRLAQHNRDLEKSAGRVVKETGRKWEIKTYIEVPDPYHAERAFWGATSLADIPYLGGIEVQKLEWTEVEAGLAAARKAGVGPPPASKPISDAVYAYTVEMRKRLQGRGIELEGLVTSRSGKAMFRCCNGHQWKGRSFNVSNGEGCPECGIGESTAENIWKAAKLGYLCLLVRDESPGVIRIGTTYNAWPEWHNEEGQPRWFVHRHRTIDDPILAEIVVWEILGKPLPHSREPLQIELSKAEQAFREFLPRMQREIALAEQRRASSPNA